MHKVTLNRMRLDLRLEPVTPLLIKSGDKGGSLLHPERPDISFVRTSHGGVDTVYVPGSSLKGVVRSAAERVLLTLRDGLACDPLNSRGRCHDEASRLGDEIARRRDTQDPHAMAGVHKMLCAACRTFGSQAMASRLSFADLFPPAAYAERTNAVEARSGVSIDRMSGGPARGKLFDMELVTGGGFEGSIHGVNLQLWQLALLGHVLTDLREGFVRCGSAKSRGLGHVRVVPGKLTFTQAREAPGPAGVGSLRPDFVGPYGLHAGPEDRLADPVGGKPEEDLLGPRWSWTDEAVWGFFEACAAGPWKAFARAAVEGRA